MSGDPRQDAADPDGLILTPGSLIQGVWQGRLACVAARHTPPDIVVTHQGEGIDGVTVTPDGDGWMLRFEIPARILSDGVQTLIIAQHDGPVPGRVLGRVAILAGDALDDDLRAELALMRAEIDLLKKAFRRHAAPPPTGD